MSIKNLFSNGKVVVNKNYESDYDYAESAENVSEQIKLKNRFIPLIDYSNPTNFSFFGSAKEYYDQALENIANTFPYDGTKREVAEFLNQSSFIDLYIFNNLYPRQNGYVNISSNGWGDLVGSQIFGLGKSTNLEYIYVKGGPHTASGGMIGKDLSSTFDYSNKYDTNIYDNAGVQSIGRVGTRESNLKCDFDNGVTVEFWLKKTGFDATKSESEVVFDLWNGKSRDSENCGRFAVNVSYGGADPDKCLGVVLQSGSTIKVESIPGYSDTLWSEGKWNHYAVSVYNSNSELKADFYLNGSRVYTTPPGFAVAFGEFTGSINATIGALQTGLPFVDFDGVDAIGYGKLSGSLDEFRFWKAKRNQEQIFLNMSSQVGGGTNNDISNTELGVYFKFNEGITGTPTYDSVVLDYSGRISNGKWVGYPGSSARSLDSALVESGKAKDEFKDPTIYKSHPRYLAIKESLEMSGSVHDDSNTSMLLRTMPSWVVEEDEEKDGELKKLVQIVSNTFDQVYLMAQHINKPREISYNLGVSVDTHFSGTKQYPFNDVILESYGLDTTELFPNQTLLEFLQNRNETSQYKTDLTDVKNEIYRNIYNNLNYIYKSKGTEKSIRNMLRCLGINEEIVKLNMYSRNDEYLLENKYSEDTYYKKYINFYNSASAGAVITQVTSSNLNTDGINYIKAQPNEYGAITSEVNVLFPKKATPNIETPYYYSPLFVTSSIFGVMRVATTPDENNFVWRADADISSTPNGDTDFQVFAIRPDIYSSDALFKITNRAGTINLTSSLYKDVYSNNEWNFAVRIKNKKFPYASTGSIAISGSAIVGADSDLGFDIEFLGFNTVGSYVKNTFSLTSSISNIYGKTLLKSNKRYYAGAFRENYTGSLQHQSDIKLGFVRHYDHYVDNEALLVHAIDRTNYGFKDPHVNAYLFNSGSSLVTSYVPKVNFNVMNIDFELVTGSNLNGMFNVVDFSSGSLNNRSNYPQQISGNLQTQYEFSGFLFAPNYTDLVTREVLNNAKLKTFEEIGGSDLVRILERDDELFEIQNPVQGMNFAIEKSYYGIISKEILDFYGGIVAFNNLIGEVSDKYKSDYKKLRYLRNNFFDKIQDQRGAEKFYEFYKWIDDSITHLITQLVPVSADFDTNVRDLIESHILERNKIKHQYPLLDYKGNTRFADDPIEGTIKSRQELKVNWKYNTPPIKSDGTLDLNESKNADWWKNNSVPTKSGNSSGNSNVDRKRLELKNVIYNKNQKKFVPLRDNNSNNYYSTTNNNNYDSNSDLTVDVTKTNIQGGVNTPYSKASNLFRAKISQFSKNRRSSISLTRVNVSQVQDDLEIKRNVKIPFKVGVYVDSNGNQVLDDYYFENAEFISPISFVSESRETPSGYQSATSFRHQINNIHGDHTSKDLGIPMQTPFSQEHVGGNQHRHQGLNNNPNAKRSELFRIVVSDASTIRLINPQGAIGSTDTDTNLPYMVYYRDEFAKRPVNIKNILFNTSSYALGNYRRDYEVLQTYGRTTNNKSFVAKEGFATASISSSYFFNTYDFAKPNRSKAFGNTNDGNKAPGSTGYVIVNRFSAPGGPETAGDNQGGPGLDYESAEFSPYNNINYRNISVRIPLNKIFLTSYSDKYGLTSGSVVSSNKYYGINTITASYHKTFRNSRKVVTQNNSQDFVSNQTSTKVRRDNAFISTPIPSTDLQYSWISASYKNANFLNYQTQDGYVSGATGLSEAIVFVSSSDFFSYKSAGIRGYGSNAGQIKSGTEFIYDPFVQINLNVSDPINLDKFTTGIESTNKVTDYLNRFLISNSVTASSTGSNRLDSGIYSNPNYGPGGQHILNALLLGRNGPYGYPVFKQVRVSDSKLVRALNKENRYFFTEKTPLRILVNDTLSGKTDVINGNSAVINSITQSPVTSKYSSIKLTLAYIENPNNPTDFKDTVLYASHVNEYAYFYDKVFNSKLNLIKRDKTAAERIFDTYKTSKTLGPVRLEYSETIYPKEKNTYLNYSRQRIRFENNFWLSNRNDRNTKGLLYKNESITRPGFGYNRRSSWDLDVFKEFETYNFNDKPAPSVGPNSMSIYSPSGILQNYTTYMKFDQGTGATLSDISASSLQVEPLFARPQLERNISSVVSKWGMKIKSGGDGSFVSSSTEVVSNARSFIGSGFAKWEAGQKAGRYIVTKSLDSNELVSRTFVSDPAEPFYNSYEDYSEEIKAKGKGYTTIPEFRISEHTQKILSNQINPKNIENFLSFPNEYIVRDSTDQNFFEMYVNSDSLENFESVRESNKNILKADTITLKIKGLKKLIPYNGFYPSERTVQIAKEFFNSFPEVVFEATGTTQVSNTVRSRPILQSLFAPGILYNTIKSGIAVDYPILTGAYVENSRTSITGNNTGINSIQSNFSDRIPFEAIYQPQAYLDGKTIYDNETTTVAIAGSRQEIENAPVSDRLYNKLRFNSFSDRPYNFAINNFLAETTNLFLEKSKPTTILSLPESQFQAVEVGKPYGMRIKMFRSLDRPQPNSGSWGNYPVPQIMRSSDTKPTIYLYFNKALYNGVTTRASWANVQIGDSLTSRVLDPGVLAPDASLRNLFMQITMSVDVAGNTKSYQFSSQNLNVSTDSGFNLNTDTLFTIDSSSGSYTSTSNNLSNLLNSLEAAINSGSSYVSGGLRATNLGEISGIYMAGGGNNNIFSGSQNVFLPAPPYDVNGNLITLPDPINFNFDLSSRFSSPEPYTYGVIKIETTSSLASTINIVSSQNPATYLNSIVNKFCFASTMEPTELQEFGQLNSSNLFTSGNFVEYSGIPHETFTMYSRPTAFGPPTNGITSSGESKDKYLKAQDSANGFNWPFTPPYYYGESWMDIIYVPQNSFAGVDSGITSFVPKINNTGIQEENSLFVFPQAPVEGGTNYGIWTKFWRYDYTAGSNPGYDCSARDGNINKNAMQMTASILPFEIEVDSDGNRRWSIKTKFETPNLNFNHLTGSGDVFYPTGYMSMSVPRGIWHQFGRIPNENEGVYLQVTDIPASWLNNRNPYISDVFVGGGGIYDITGSSWQSGGYKISSSAQSPLSLRSVCGFSDQPVKIGTIATQRKFKEAVVAIPFVEENGVKKFFELDKAQVDKYLQVIELLETENNDFINDYDVLRDKIYQKLSSDLNNTALYNEMLTNSVSDMIIKMKNFVIPPQFDFLTYPETNPISMYVFPFEFVLDRDDLSYIWQNLTPAKFGKTMSEEEIVINHKLFSNELMGDWTKKSRTSNVRTGMPKNVRWMVFKVKQKAIKDYTKVLKGYYSLDTDKLNSSYNWPYDFFSIVELAKVDASVSMVTKANNRSEIVNYVEKPETRFKKNKLPPPVEEVGSVTDTTPPIRPAQDLEQSATEMERFYGNLVKSNYSDPLPGVSTSVEEFQTQRITGGTPSSTRINGGNLVRQVTEQDPDLDNEDQAPQNDSLRRGV